MQNTEAEKDEKRTGCYRYTQMQKDLIIREAEGTGAAYYQTEDDPSGHYPGGGVLLL